MAPQYNRAVEHASVILIDEASGKRQTFIAEPGATLLGVALAGGIPIEHTCGGVAACSTCHVVIRSGAGLLNEPSDAELDQLDLAPNRRPESRLACQAKVMAPGEIEAVIPRWNRNAVKESGR